MLLFISSQLQSKDWGCLLFHPNPQDELIEDMTTLQKFIAILVSQGMFESQAVDVMNLAIPVFDRALDSTDEDGKTIRGYELTLNSPADGYPDVVYNVIYNLHIKPMAVEYIERECPNAWFKPMFVNSPRLPE